MSERSYPGFTGLPKITRLTAERRAKLSRAIEALELKVEDPARFHDDVCEVAEWLEGFHSAENENTIGARIDDVDRALAASRLRPAERAQLNPANQFHMVMLRHLRPADGEGERLMLLRKWLGQQRPGRGTRPRRERSNAVLHLSRVWQSHGLGLPPSTHGSDFATLLCEVFEVTIGGTTERELHNLIYKAVSEGSIEEGQGFFKLNPPPPRK